MNRTRILLGAGMGLATLMLPFAGTASALTVSGSVGPVPVPSVPVTLCVNANCVSTPAATTVQLNASVTLTTALGLPPTVTPALCPPGQFGPALVITTGTSSATIGASVTVLVNGVPRTFTVGPITVDPSKTVTINACST